MIKCLLLLTCLAQEPQWELVIDPGAAASGAFRANILGASYTFANIPTTPTITIQDITYGFTSGDRITVNDATTFYVYDGITWRPLLSDYHWNLLDKRIKKLEADPVIEYLTITITIKPQGNGIYSFKETLAEETDIWYMPFPTNKKVDPDGLFTATINGWEFAPLARIILGEGGRQLGLQFMLLDGSLWPVGTEGIGSIQLIDFTPWVVPEYATEQTRTPKTLMHEGLARNLVNF